LRLCRARHFVVHKNIQGPILAALYLTARTWFT
jgi:hypothetical protein